MSETAPEPATTAGNELDAVARSVVSVFGGSVGIAVAGADGVISGGDDGAYPAWSTIKVPIAVAATRVAPDQAQLYAPAAIHNSDNVAAESLWALVTPGDVNQVLADAGVDASVNTLPIRTEFSTFGQTALSASQEATLAGHLACVAGAKDVLELMGNVSPDQAYGLGQLPGARLKGGWGPSPSGGYQVRQVARVTNTRGNDVALALTVIPATGEYASAQAMADAVAAELRPLLDALPTAAC
ncbi:class A beta-lactamase-related serine hydrolase [Corynebacterium lipophiloflavum]|nr:class A beta-lactamase-related serine hydrolase [Corynebacterium lipophiloflavum]